MFLDRADVILRAHEVGRGLTDLERIALGVTLAQTVLTPGNHGAVRLAAARLSDHADALLDAEIALSDSLSDGPDTGPKPTTHEQPGSSERPADAGRPAPSVKPASSGRWRAAWDRFARAERRFSDSLAGDLVGVVSLAILVITAMFLPLIVPT